MTLGCKRRNCSPINPRSVTQAVVRKHPLVTLGTSTWRPGRAAGVPVHCCTTNDWLPQAGNRKPGDAKKGKVTLHCLVCSCQCLSAPSATSTPILCAHHDVGLEDSSSQFDASLAAADLVICQTGCISHSAYWRVKDHCKRHGKRCVFVDNPSVSSLARGLQEAAIEEAQPG